MNRTYFWAGIGLAIALIWMFPAPALAGRALRILTYNHPPNYMQAEDGQWTGIDIDLAGALCREAGFDTEFQQLPWNRAMGYIETGHLDMIVGLTRTPERETFIEFIGVCKNEQFGIVMHRKDMDLPLNTLDDFVAIGGTWGIRNRMHYSEEFNNRLENDPTFRSLFDLHSVQAGNFEKIAAGRLRGLIGEMIGVKYYILSNPHLSDLVVREVPFFPPSPVFFGVTRKMTVEDMEKLRTAHKKLEARGEFAGIVKKWVGSGN